MVVKKRIFQFALLIALIYLLTSCAGVGDWTSEPLPGGYVVQRANNRTVELCLPVDGSYFLTTPVIKPIVTAVAYNEDYILVKRKDIIDSFSDLKKLFQRDYYIFDVNKRHVAGPYEKKDFEKKCKKLKISDITWKDVSNLKKQENM